MAMNNNKNTTAFMRALMQAPRVRRTSTSATAKACRPKKSVPIICLDEGAPKLEIRKKKKQREGAEKKLREELGQN
jgi:hypothetical protein